MPIVTEAQLKAKLIIDPPSELVFCGPFNRQVLIQLKLTNPSDNFVLFKIKTTAPKRYCVRPNFGIVNPHQSVTVEICLQPFDFDPSETIKHKFMVQSVFFPADGDVDNTNYFQIWKEIPSDKFMDAKLKCVFELERGDCEADPGNATKKFVKNEASSAPEIKSEEKQISNLDASDKSESLREELEQLRDKLKRENINLKEEIIRLRSSQSKPSMGEPYTPVMAEKQIPMFYIAIAIAAVIFGILLGKFLL